MDCVCCGREIIGYTIAYSASVCEKNHLTCITCVNIYGPVCGICGKPVLFCDILRESCSLILFIDMNKQTLQKRNEALKSNEFTAEIAAAEEQVIEESIVEEEDCSSISSYLIEDEDTDYDDESVTYETEINPVGEKMVSISLNSSKSFNKSVDTSDLDSYQVSSFSLNSHPILFEHKYKPQMSYNTLLSLIPPADKELERIANRKGECIGIYYDQYGKPQEINCQKEPNICYTNPFVENFSDEELRLYMWRMVKENNVTKSEMFVLRRPETDARMRSLLELIQTDNAPRWQFELKKTK